MGERGAKTLSVKVNAKQASIDSGLPTRLIQHCVETYDIIPDVDRFVGRGKTRLYSPRDVHVMKIIKRLLDIGFTLEKIREIVK